MVLPPEELIAIIQYQIGALQALCHAEDADVEYVKPHGALYNDMMKNSEIFTIICRALAQLNNSSKQPLALMIQAIKDSSAFETIAKAQGIKLYFEAFADRAYQDNGLLVPRSEPNAVLSDNQTVIARCTKLINNEPLLSINQQPIEFHLDALCVHGDTPNALAMLKALRQTITNNAK